MSVEQWPNLCEELALQIADHSSTGAGNPVAEVDNDSESEVFPADVSILTTSPVINVMARGSLVQHHRDK